jgi:hypothetical protein
MASEAGGIAGARAKPGASDVQHTVTDAMWKTWRAACSQLIDFGPMKPLRDKPIPPNSNSRTRRIAAAGIVLASLACSWAAAERIDPACGNPFANSFGPYDYRFERGQNLKVVEDFHFNPRVESLIAGQSGTVGGDLDYVLRAFPNHHRALIAMMKLGVRTKGVKPAGAQFAVDCYFKRALLFRPDDAVARMIFVKYLADTGRKPEANGELDRVVKATQDNAVTQHNAGLLYFELGDFDRALAQAHRAGALGYQGQTLKQQLQAAGKWVDPQPQAPDRTASSTAAAAPTSAAMPASAPSR